MRYNMNNDNIVRINELYHKSKLSELSEQEKVEQTQLRKDYVLAIKQSLKANLNNISITEDDGSITDLGKKFGNIKEV